MCASKSLDQLAAGSKSIVAPGHGGGGGGGGGGIQGSHYGLLLVLLIDS